MIIFTINNGCQSQPLRETWHLWKSLDMKTVMTDRVEKLLLDSVMQQTEQTEQVSHSRQSRCRTPYMRRVITTPHYGKHTDTVTIWSVQMKELWEHRR